MKGKNKTKIYEFDDFTIKSIEEADKDYPDQIKKFYELIVKGLRVTLEFNGALNVLPLEKGIYLIRGHDGHVLLRKNNTETAIDQFPIQYPNHYVDYVDDSNGLAYHKILTEFETYPYKFSMKMLKLGLIVLRVDCKYNLINFRTGKTLLSGFDNIEDVDGNIMVEKAIYTTEGYSDGHNVNSFTYPSDVLVGKLNSNYEIDGCQLISQKYGISVDFVNDGDDLQKRYDLVTYALKDNPEYTFDCTEYQADKEGVRK